MTCVHSSGCMIHCSDDTTPIVSIKDEASWKTLLEAAKVRDYQHLLGIEDFQKVQYHRKCRQVFTMKRDLEKITKNKNEKNVPKPLPRKQHERNKTSSHILPPRCIFCDKVEKYNNRK